MLLSNKLKLSVAALSLVIGVEVYASNDDLDGLNVSPKNPVAAAVPATVPAPAVVLTKQPQTRIGNILSYAVGTRAVTSFGGWLGYNYDDQAPKTQEQEETEINALMDSFEELRSGVEIDAAIVADEELKAAEEAAAETIYDANVRFVVRCTVEAYGDDYDELTREEIGYLVEGYHKGNLGGAYEQLREGKKRDSRSFEEKVKNMSEQVKPTVVEAPKPKTALGWFASYLISERAVVAVGRKLGYTYGDDAKSLEVVAPVNKASASALSTEEEKVLRTFAGLSEENQKRVMLAIENGSLAQLIMDTTKPNNNHVEEVAEDDNQLAMAPAAPEFIPPTPAYVAPASAVAPKAERAGSFLDAIKSGKILKKVEAQSEERKGSDSEGSDEKVNSLASALLAMRGKIDGSSLDEQNDDVWSDNDE